MIIKPIKTRIFKEKEDLFSFVIHYIKKVPEKSVIVITSKIVTLSEGRVVLVDSEKERERIIKSESKFALRTKYTWLTVKDGTIMSSAGIDESNGNGKTILLPKNSFKSAENLREKLKKHYKVKHLGILITDSRLLPLRVGIVGIALGYAGFKGIRDYRETRDIFGRKLKLSRTDVADSLATAAVLELGEGNEQQPLALITKAPIEFCDKVNRNELRMDVKNDVYYPLLSKLKNYK